MHRKNPEEKKPKTKKSWKRVVVITAIVLAVILAAPVSYLGYQVVNQHMWVGNAQTTVPELTAAQKRADFTYLTETVLGCYPFTKANAQIKGLDDLSSLSQSYIEKAAATADNEEFFVLFLEYLERLHQTGHAYFLNPDQAAALNTFSYRALLGIKKESFNKSEYWYKLYQSASNNTYSDLDVAYRDGGYFLVKDGVVASTALPAGTQIVKINGLAADVYVKNQQGKHWLRFDSVKKKVYLADPFCVDPGKSSWTVDFTLPDGSAFSGEVSKNYGYKATPSFAQSSYNKTFCSELDEKTGYIRVHSFLSSVNEDGQTIQAFMQASDNRYQKLIIDIRGNSGGDPMYWIKNFVEPLIKNTKVVRQGCALTKTFSDRLGFEFWLYRLTGGGMFGKDYGFTDMKKIGETESGLVGYQVTRTYMPQNSFPFSGKVYLLTDTDCFSAAEDFAVTVKSLGLATVIGANTQGGTAALIPPYTFCLPESGIMFNIEPELSYNRDGTINEIYGTKPDVVLETSRYPTTYPTSDSKETLLADPWVQWVLQH